MIPQKPLISMTFPQVHLATLQMSKYILMTLYNSLIAQLPQINGYGAMAMEVVTPLKTQSTHMHTQEPIK